MADNAPSPAQFYLSDFKVLESSMLMRLIDDSDLHVDFGVRGVFTPSSKVYKLEVLLRIFETPKSDRPFNIEESTVAPRITCKCEGEFKFAGDMRSAQDLPEFFYANATAILFPYLRSFVSTVSLQSNWGLNLLPTLNLSGLGAELRAKTETAG